MPRRGDKQQAALYFAEEWGLDTVPKRRAHARRFVTIDVVVKEPAERSVFALPVLQRKPALKDLRKRRTTALAAAIHKLRAVEAVPTSHGFRCKLRVAELDRIRRSLASVISGFVGWRVCAALRARRTMSGSRFAVAS